MENFSVITCLLFSLCLLFFLFLRRGISEPLVIIATYYFFFAFGPVINYLLGWDIYFGTIISKIPEATMIFSLGMIGFFVAAFLIKSKSARLYQRDAGEGKQSTDFKWSRVSYPALHPFICVMIIFGFYQITNIMLHGRSESKLATIQQLGDLHYAYLLLQYFILPFYFFFQRTKSSRILFLTNILIYLCYCLIAQERDFIFIIISMIFHANYRDSQFKQTTFNLIKRNWRFATFCVILLVTAFVLSIERSSGLGYDSGAAGLLNQGSLLFVNTQILDFVDSGLPLQNGMTYVYSILNLLPRWAYSTDFRLIYWFKDLYAPTSESGYGFALDAEAYLNFGYIGVPIVIFILAGFQKYLFNRIKSHPFYLYFSIFYMATLMYSLRNDSLALLKSGLYACIFFFCITEMSRLLKRRVPFPLQRQGPNHSSRIKLR